MSSPNIFAMRAARASLGDEAFLVDTRRRIIASRKRITTSCSVAGSPTPDRKQTLCFSTRARRSHNSTSS